MQFGINKHSQIFKVVLILKTQQRFSDFGTCFDVSNIIISHNE